MTLKEVLQELQSLGDEKTRKIHQQHGATEPLYGVKVADLKIVQKKIRNDQQLAMELYNSGVYDAMYLAGLVADGGLMTREQLREWVEKASGNMISEYTVPWVASESPFAWELAQEWIGDTREPVAAAGWSLLSNIMSVTPDEKLDIKALKQLIKRAEKQMDQAANRVKYTMNNFIIAAGCFVKDLTDDAMASGKKLGKVIVDMGNTACVVPYAPDYIEKVQAMGRIGKKKKTVKC